jgi:hypothetical protein
MNIMQIDWLQPIYTLTFSNGLIACLVFMGIGVLLDVGYVMARPSRACSSPSSPNWGRSPSSRSPSGWASIRAKPLRRSHHRRR